VGSCAQFLKNFEQHRNAAEEIIFKTDSSYGPWCAALLHFSPSVWSAHTHPRACGGRRVLIEATCSRYRDMRSASCIVQALEAKVRPPCHGVCTCPADAVRRRRRRRHAQVADAPRFIEARKARSSKGPLRAESAPARCRYRRHAVVALTRVLCARAGVNVFSQLDMSLSFPNKHRYERQLEILSAKARGSREANHADGVADGHPRSSTRAQINALTHQLAEKGKALVVLFEGPDAAGKVRSPRAVSRTSAPVLKGARREEPSAA
jgi:hypothetical protein